MPQLWSTLQENSLQPYPQGSDIFKRTSVTSGEAVPLYPIELH